jgi:hypothetical protein
VDAQPAPRRGNTDARQQKARREMQHLIYFLKHPDAILATYG